MGDSDEDDLDNLNEHRHATDHDHDRLLRIEERQRAIFKRVEHLEMVSAETSRIVAGWKGGMAMFIAVGGGIGWIISHVGDWIGAVRGAR